MIPRSRLATAPLLASLAIVVSGYFTVSARRRAHWVRVASDANYDVAIDRARITEGRIAAGGRWFKVIEVWYRTDHALPRLYHGKTFDREVVHSIVQCDSLWFKVVSVDMSIGDHRLVVRQRTSASDLYDQPWHRVERGTTEEMAALAACHHGANASIDLDANGRTR